MRCRVAVWARGGREGCAGRGAARATTFWPGPRAGRRLIARNRFATRRWLCGSSRQPAIRIGGMAIESQGAPAPSHVGSWQVLRARSPSAARALEALLQANR